MQNPLPRLTELEDAIQAREGPHSALLHSLIVQSVVLVATAHAENEAGAKNPRIKSLLAETGERLSLLIKLSPDFDHKQVAAMLAAFQADLSEQRQGRGN